MNEYRSELILVICQSMEIDLPDNISISDLKQKLAYHCNELIQNNFQKLVSILYRIDINETELKCLLKENPGTDAGDIIAYLIIERQLQKIKSRQRFRDDPQIPDEEKW